MQARIPLEGTTWVLTPATPLPIELGGVTVTAEFEHGRVTGTSGCNQYTTGFAVDGPLVSIAPGIAGTRKLCEPAVNDVERAYLERLPLAASYEIEGSTLTVLDGGRAPLLVFEALDHAAAILGPWEVVSYYRGDAITSVIGGVTITADFDGASVSGSTGVNQYHGGYQVDGRSISFGEMAVTLRAALDPELGEQEAHYLAALRLARTFEVTGDRLHLYRDGGTIAAVYGRPVASS